MKKSILSFGKALNKEDQKSIKGGFGLVPFICTPGAPCNTELQLEACNLCGGTCAPLPNNGDGSHYPGPSICQW